MTEEEKTTLRIEAAKTMDWEVDMVPLERLPNPLENDTHLNALLVATLARGWYVRYLNGRSIKLEHTIRKIGAIGDLFSDNPDSPTAYRELVTLACVAAYHAEQKASASHSQPRRDEEGGKE